MTGISSSALRAVDFAAFPAGHAGALSCIAVAKLADLMVMERTTLVRALKPLQTQGLIPSVAAGVRASLELSLSTSGVAKLREAESLWKAAQQEWEGRIGEDRAISIRNEIRKIDLS